MILPVGHDQGGVRRLPWVSFGIMALCVAAFLAVRPSATSLEHGSEALTSAIEYYFEHPYLELHATLDDILSRAPGGPGQGQSSLLEAARESIPPPADRETLAAQQAKLDELAARALDSLRADPYRRWGLVPAHLSAVALVTHMFIHAGWLHLIGNLLIFYLAGPFVEDVWGRPLFAVFYLVSGWVAALTHVGRFGDSVAPLVGASGAIAGVMGAFLVRYWHTRIRFLYVFGLLIRGTFDAPAWVMLPLWFGAQVFFAVLTGTLSGAAGEGVAYWAHIGGFLFGAGFAYVLKRQRVEERFLRPSLETKVVHTVVEHSEIERALEAHARGASDEALACLGRLVEENPAHEEAALAYWSVAAGLGRPEQAAGGLVRLIEAELRAGKPDIALAHWTELNVRVPDPPAGPELLVRISQLLDREGRRDEAVVALRRALLAAGSGMPAGLALRIARAARAVDPRVARGAARLVLTRPHADPAERAHAERILAESAPSG